MFYALGDRILVAFLLYPWFFPVILVMLWPIWAFARVHRSLRKNYTFDDLLIFSRWETDFFFIHIFNFFFRYFYLFLSLFYFWFWFVIWPTSIASMRFFTRSIMQIWVRFFVIFGAFHTWLSFWLIFSILSNL